MVSIWYAFNVKCTFNITLKAEKVAWRNVALINVPQIKGFSRATFLFVFLFIYLFVKFCVCVCVCVCEWLLSATFTGIIIFFCVTFSGWDTWNVKLQASNLKQTLTINVSTIFLLKSMSSNIIQAFNIFERY